MMTRYHIALTCAFGLGLGLMAVGAVDAAAPSPAAAEAPVASSTDPAAAAAKPADAKKADANKSAEQKKDGAKAADAKSAPGRRPLDSLMFSTDEFNEIQSRMASGEVTETQQATQQIENATLYLSTILYYGPKDWTIWVNGVAITPSQDFQAFQVTEIDANSVQLLVPLSAQGMRPVRLSPNQTFITKTGMVVEGRVQQ